MHSIISAWILSILTAGHGKDGPCVVGCFFYFLPASWRFVWVYVGLGRDYSCEELMFDIIDSECHGAFQERGNCVNSRVLCIILLGARWRKDQSCSHFLLCLIEALVIVNIL